jgi:hypothetical protein
MRYWSSLPCTIPSFSELMWKKNMELRQWQISHMPYSSTIS